MNENAGGKSKIKNYFTRQRGSWGDAIRIIVCLVIIKIFGIIVGLIASALIIFALPKIFKSGKGPNKIS